MNNFLVEFYKKGNGECPVAEFLDHLDVKISCKLSGLIMLLERNGNDLREPYSKHIEDGIFELRVKQGSNIVRVLYFFILGRKIIITNGFVKKTNKIPQKEIKLAKKFRSEYLRRGEIDEV